jgi:hypothetical protein
MITIKQINERIAPLGYELIKGKDYFYFHPLSNMFPLLSDSMVLVCHVNELSLNDWTNDLINKIEAENLKI